MNNAQKTHAKQTKRNIDRVDFGKMPKRSHAYLPAGAYRPYGNRAAYGDYDEVDFEITNDDLNEGWWKS